MKGKKRNPYAMALRSPHLRPASVPSKKVYSRKGRNSKGSAPSDFLDRHFPLHF